MYKIPKAKNYNYTAIYGYIMDLICAFVTDYRDTEGAITEGNNNYYLINLRRETVEKYAFGEYTKTNTGYDLCQCGCGDGAT